MLLVWFFVLFCFIYFLCAFMCNFSFIVQTLQHQIRFWPVGFHDIMDSEECPGHSYSGEQSIFNCSIAKFTVRFAAFAREGRVGCLLFQLLKPSSAAPTVVWSAKRTRQPNSLMLVSIPVYLPWSIFSVGSVLTILKFLLCQC